MTAVQAEARAGEGCERRVRGYCALCTAHCATVAVVEKGRVVRLEADPDHPNGGVICIKGRASPELVYHPERLNYPLRRSRPKGAADPGWQRVSWEEALGAIAARLEEIRRRYGPRAVALAKGTRSGTSVDDAERWLSRFLSAFGSPNWVSTTHVCNWHRDTGFSYTFGVNLPRPDLAKSGALLLWGHNPSATSIVFAHDIVEARRRGMRLVAVDPRRVGLAAQAELLLQVRPGSDGALALALIHALLEEGWYDAEFVRRWTNGPFLLRAEGDLAVSEADLSAGGSRERYVVWDERRDAIAIYDPASGTFDRDGVAPLLFGRRELEGRGGERLRCRTALEALAARAARYAPERSEAITRVAAEKVWRAAELLAHSRPVSLYMWNGVGQHTNATQTSRAIGVLYALLGDFDRPGGNVIFPGPRLNRVDGKEWLAPEEAALRIGREKKPLGPPARPGNCAAPDIFTAILEGKPYPIKALLNFGSNTILSSADSRRAREAFCALEFAVAVDLFMTPTAELCDYVLPATSFLEMANLAGGFEHRPAAKLHLQYRPAVVEPLYERRSDTWIVFELAKRLGMGERFWNGDIEAGYAYELEPSGVTLEQLKAAPGGISVRAETRYEKHAEGDARGVAHGFATPSRRVEIYSSAFAAHGFAPLPEYVEPALSPLSTPEVAAEYPLVLTNAKFTAFVHSQQRALPTLRKAAPEPEAEIHPETALRYAIRHRQWMVVETPRGAIRVRARVTDRILPGVVCCQHGWWQECRALGLPGYDPYEAEGANPSAIIGAELADPISGSFPHRSYLCRVRPAKPQ